MVPISLKQLRYICAVAEHCHFGKAAEACFVSQSSLSAGVHELESQLDTVLFERTHKQVIITAAGRELVRRAHLVLREADDLVAYARQKTTPLSGELHLGVIPTIAPFLLPKLLSFIRSCYPDLQLYLREDLSANLLQRLQQGELDLVLWALPYPSAETCQQVLFEDPFLLVCGADHPFSQRTLVRQQDLQGQQLLLLEEGHCLREHALEACKLGDRQFSQSFQGTSLHTLVQMVANGIGLTLLPKMAVDSGILAATGLVARAFEEASVARTIGMVWRNSDPRGRDYRLLAETVQRHHQTS